MHNAHTSARLTMHSVCLRLSVETQQHYIHKVIDVVNVYENLTCLMPTRLNIPGKAWKLDITGAEKSWKTHIKRSWKLAENHFW